jgi:hypothetical protein
MCAWGRACGTAKSKFMELNAVQEGVSFIGQEPRRKTK